MLTYSSYFKEDFPSMAKKKQLTKMVSRFCSFIFFIALVFETVWAKPFALPVPPLQTDTATVFAETLKTHTQTFLIPDNLANLPATGLSTGKLALLALPSVASGVEAMQAMRTAGLGGVVPPLYLGGTLLSTAAMIASLNQMERSFYPASFQAYFPQNHRQHSTLTITIWDNNLLDAYVLDLSQKNNVEGAFQIENYRQSLLSQYPIEKEIVLEIQITNNGMTPIRLSPFSDHIFLVDAKGEHCKPLGYDASLNEIVESGGTVSGKVYFPKINPVDNATVNQNGIHGALDNVNGKTFFFNFPNTN
jgi:hypothetical protein